MALIGRNTVTGNFIKCSNLTPDGSTTTFTLTNSTTGDNVYPGNQNSLIVSVSGVIQNPGTAYTINNNQIIFSTAPSISDTIDFIVIMGDLVAIGTPSDDTVDTVHIKDGAVHNTKLQNSAITINGTSINLGASGTIVAGTDWQAVITADGSTATTAVAGEGYFIDNSSAAHTINLPSSPSLGDTVSIVALSDAGVNNITVGRNGSNIQGSASDYIINSNNQSDVFVYSNASEGWTIQSTTKEPPAYISATGGTVTESGDYKIHTFTGDGCFVVSSIGNQSTDLDYLVIAGGGSGGGRYGGGGGAGGYRESSGTATGSYTVSPLGSGVTALTATAATYPVTVGGGGANPATDVPGDICGSAQGNRGSNSVFATITSTGGGGGAGQSNPSPGPQPGGSGGGASYNVCSQGTGNTPPVSPPQGNPGGNNTTGGTSPYTSAGGGGASAAGADSTPGNPGAGGNGATSSINGTPTTRAGGGGGGGSVHVPVGGSPGGAGGGAAGGSVAGARADAGTVNTGGGGGGGMGNPGMGGAGGSGVVIIRYKYQ